CGHSTTCLQVITVQDSTSPDLDCPANVTVSCAESTLPVNAGLATASDNCGAVDTLYYSDEVIEGACPNTFTIERTWIAVDLCGNSTSCLQVVEVVDETAPLLACPANLTLECTAGTEPDSTGFATATDNCDAMPEIAYADDTVAGGCPNEWTIQRTWT